jgi:PAS domain-containing protein
MAAPAASGSAGTSRVGPPAWLVAATAILAFGSLAMAVAETSLWMHYLIDAGESISLVGLAFIVVAGIYLYSRRRLLLSLPLAVPWLLFPVITQGDQIIDNLSINWMRTVSHVLLAVLFGTPVAVVVLAVRYAVAPRDGQPRNAPAWLAIVPGLRAIREGRVREGSAALAATLLVLEMWVAARFLGLLMVVTLIVMVWAVLAHGSAASTAEGVGQRQRSERFALILLLSGAALSVGLFFGFKNRPGAYQGSPSYYMDPSQKDTGFRLDLVAVPANPPVAPSDSDAARAALTGYARAFEQLLDGYYVLDRNYNYNFHNELFLRSTPLLADYRRVGLSKVREAEALRAQADAAAAGVRTRLASGDPLGALFEDLALYAAFTFDRARVLERMSGEFERTRAGLQHATHIYEGEGKVLGVRLSEIVAKHNGVLSSPAVAPLAADFVKISRAVYDKYANRIVGF